MELLKYEFMDSADGSYNGILGSLVKQVRYCRTVPADQIKDIAPLMKSLQSDLRLLDEDMLQPERHYINEIMEELEKEDEIEEKLLDDVNRTIKVMTKALSKNEITIEDFSFNYINHEAVYWLSFNGYKDEKEADTNLIIAKECFRSTCSKHGVIFIDCNI